MIGSTPLHVWFIGCMLLASSLGVLIVKKPVHASLSFLLSLISLAMLYLELTAEFIAVMQLLVYAGAILVIFMFVIILFQDAHNQIEHLRSQTEPLFLMLSSLAFLLALFLLAGHVLELDLLVPAVSRGDGSVRSIGKTLYVDFFFPFEMIILLFLVAVVGALYTARRES